MWVFVFNGICFGFELDSHFEWRFVFFFIMKIEGRSRGKWANVMATFYWLSICTEQGKIRFTVSKVMALFAKKLFRTWACETLANIVSTTNNIYVFLSKIYRKTIEDLPTFRITRIVRLLFYSIAENFRLGIFWFHSLKRLKLKVWCQFISLFWKGSNRPIRGIETKVPKHRGPKFHKY